MIYESYTNFRLASEGNPDVWTALLLFLAIDVSQPLANSYLFDLYTLH